MKLSFYFRLLLLAALTSLMMLCAGCKKTTTYRIGVSQCSDDDWRKKMNEEILREGLLHDDVEIEIRSADDNNQKQIDDIEYFASNGFDIIVAAPREAEALTPVIKKTYEAGIPVLLFDRNINGNSFTAFQGADNVAIGELAAQMARHLGGEGAKVIEIRGLKGSSPEEGRHRGFNEAAQNLRLHVVGEGYGDWNQERGKVVADSLLSKYPEATVIYAHNDRMAIAGAEVARKAGRSNIKIIGIDAAPSIGIQAVKDSIIDATFLYPTAGGQLIKTSLAILKGQPYEKNLILPSSSAVDLTNAELLLLQDNAMREETEKIETLKSQLDDYWKQYSIQNTILYCTIAFMLLFGVTLFLAIRAYRIKKRHQQLMETRNRELAKQRDELHNLYDKLQAATSSKLTFFTNVSHDLRTPLTLIADPVSQLSHAENLTPQQHTLVKLAEKNVKRLMRLVNQILDIRKYDNSHLTLNLYNVDVAAAIREWTASFTTVAIKRHIGFSTDIVDGENYMTAIDIEKIERVLFNLLSNSFKFTPENGQIIIGLKREGNDILLTVKDTGCGIAEEDVKNVFDRFFKTEKINPTGSGIGLALSKIFVEMHGGSINVKSVVDKGTTFEVRLPVRDCGKNAQELEGSIRTSLEDAEELELVEEESVEVNEDAPTVLVIDDNKDIRTLIKSSLSENYTVVQASSGAQGIRLASKYIPDLVICDVMMPGIDGYATCKELKNEIVTSHIPVLLLTACTQDGQRTEGYASGADGYMSKPFDSEMLKARCENLIKNRRKIATALMKDAGVAVQNKENAKAPVSDIDNEFYHRFVAVVEKEMGNSSLSVEEIADQLRLSRVQMYRKIKAITNYSPAELLRNLRLERAAVVLKTTECNISEVAYSVGFTAPNHFTKCYKQYFGELPSETQQRTSKKA